MRFFALILRRSRIDLRIVVGPSLHASLEDLVASFILVWISFDGPFVATADKNVI